MAYDPLDVSSRQWYADHQAFFTSIDSAEKLLATAMQQAFDTAGSLVYKLHLLPVSAGRRCTMSAVQLLHMLRAFCSYRMKSCKAPRFCPCK